MAEAVRWGRASYPGVAAVVGCAYTCSHGISPGTAILRILPQRGLPNAFGDLQIFDGTGGIKVPLCKLDGIKTETGPSGEEWQLELVDRRWKWRDLGMIGGAYNQLDPNGKLIPWTVRSPVELALLCLAAMGETRYSIDLPPGLDSSAALAGNRFLQAGENFAPTGVNPPVNWDADTPAQALQRLCETFGRRIVYDIVNDAVLIARPGVGRNLPPGSLARQGPSLRVPQQPDGIAVVGSPTRYQARFDLEAVGEEWDGSYRPIDQLSYAPVLPGKVQTTELNCDHATPTTSPGSLRLSVTFSITPLGRAVATARTFRATATTGAETAEDLLDAIKAEYDAVGVFDFLQGFSVAVVGGTMTLTGLAVGQSFSVLAAYDFPDASLDTTTCAVETTQAASPNQSGWDFSGPPLFPNVTPTVRLTRLQAMALAQKTVFRLYRLSGRDVSGQGPINIPGFGLLVRRQQAVLLDTKVDQIAPQPGDQAVQDRDGRPLIVNLYNGYSRDKPAAVYGSVSIEIEKSVFRLNNRNANTPAGSQAFVDFSIDQTWQMVVFSQPVYVTTDDGRRKPATLQLETACHVRHPTTNQLVSYVATRPFGAGNGTGWHAEKRPDVQLNVTAAYDTAGRVTRVSLLEADAVARARYYLEGLALQYLVTGGQTAEYNGIVPVACDGAIQQATWEVGENGPKTVASRNSEHSIWVPPYPARRRAEFLRPAEMTALTRGATPQAVNVAGPNQKGQG